ncbi:DUF692 domain-containing protein [Pseudomonas typographi]|uniref:MNIO family bufferin maturase n=1 Tax=Pseudomonas typographi TaxID=2715964 RepID=UPI0016834304|nr:DUF692 domain-containing protein [Pseudomonas typographi]MBD1587310.1 DUF692 domain-containing protein [Pseudomonas typographi]
MPCLRLPDDAGAAFKPEHFSHIDQARQPVGFFEIHAENYMGAGGPPHARLGRLREDYALSVHGVALSLGGPGPLDTEHLGRLKALCDRYQPESVSEHLAWSRHGSTYLNDLLPLPYNATTLARVVGHVSHLQEALGRTVLLENPSTYVRMAHSDMHETDFLAEVARQSGCGLLLDLNNVQVCAANHGFDPYQYLARFPLHAVAQVHLAGHALSVDDHGHTLVLDSHDRPVTDSGWALYETLIERHGPLPTLVEWDASIPAWPCLLREVRQAQAILAHYRRRNP